jgi:hypothetical protein
VNERPKHCTPIPMREDHAIIIPDGNDMIPLSISGVTSYFPTRKPTMEERERFRVEGDYLELTVESPIWDPHSTIFNDLEMRFVDRYGELKDNPGTHPRQLFALATETLLHEPFMKLRISATKMSKRSGNWNAEMRLVDRYGELKDNPGTHPRQLFALATETLLHEPFMKLRISATKMSKRSGNWNAELLARNWSIGREAAERTL